MIDHAAVNDYMTRRTELLVEEKDLDALKGKEMQDYCRFIERLESLRCLSRDVMLRLVSNPEMADAPAGALAARSVALAECLLAELGKAEKGEQISEEENMMQGTLFGLFRRLYYDKRAEPTE